ncbi:ATP-binding protein [Thalassospira sp.]|uniref:sensor histidine kinase n=1 Tax=Thalassospira sp. TaxID=1912094 RepID=UPI002736DF75|nr:ATP-binding protein [Thalassospira sp.]MDP2700189.1 ATP-binding protein [Thalassospira sp.]
MLQTSASARRSARLVLLVMLILLPVTVWLSMEWQRESQTAEIEEESRKKLELYRANLQGALKEHEYLPITLASDRLILWLVENPDRGVRAGVNLYLEKLAADSGASDIYFMDTGGLTIASSNWNSEASFIGRNFAFRPYFLQAMKGATAHHFALGITSGQPGYYISHPVRNSNGRIAGVMVVKTHLSPLENRWARSNENVLVEDEHGVIIVSSRPEWRFLTMRGLEQEERAWLRRSRKYGDAPLHGMPITDGDWPDINNVTSLKLRPVLRTYSPPPFADGAIRPVTEMPLALAHDDVPSVSPKPVRYLAVSDIVPVQGWRIYMLTDWQVLEQARTGTALIAGSAHIILFGTIFVLLLRRRTMLEQIEVRDWSQRELERQVRLRTTDLMTTNQRLAQEITERRRTEDALRTAQAELVQAGKLAALGQMSAGIAHEINQPLTAIRSYADNALQFFARGKPETVERNLIRISELTERMGRITNHLKTFARRPEYDSQPVDLVPAIHKAIDLVTETGRVAGTTIRFHPPTPCPHIIAEEAQIEQVFVNLLSNAADASRDHPHPEIEIDVTPGTQSLLVAVRDNGTGISPDNMQKLFDPFFTTKPFGDGLGLGLSICYGIVRSFGGTMRAENNETGGACFTVELRQADDIATTTQDDISTPDDVPDKTADIQEAHHEDEAEMAVHRLIGP